MILVVGATGAGKSSLVNLIMGRDVAVVGQGRPVSQNMDRSEDDMIVVYDSKGYETGEESQKEFKEDLEKFVTEKGQSPTTAINLVWYCVFAPAARIVSVDGDLLNWFAARKIPVAMILTQVDCADEDQVNELKAEAKNISKTLPVFLSSQDTEIRKILDERGEGLEAVYKWSLAI